MAAPKRDKGEILTRTEKWPLELDSETEKLLLRVSDGLRDYYNWALLRERKNWEDYKARTAEGVSQNEPKFLHPFALYDEWKSMRDQDRKNDLFRAKIPANWVLETFRAVVAGYTSFFALLRNGDKDARTPNPRSEQFFQVIPGCSAFSIKEGRVVLAPEIFAKETLVFPVPEYQRKMLGRSVRLQKFVISRDERDLRRKGRFFISVSYEIPKPESVSFVPEEAVYLALGVSSIGVVSPKGQVTIPLWRSDKHWKPMVDNIDGRMNVAYPVTKGSRKWSKRQDAKRKMLAKMSSQQKQNRREIVAIDLLLRHGIHFVVSDLVVRSKEGKLADASKPWRGGPLGLNWSAQNTGAIAYLVAWLEEKVKEHGGTVRKHKLPAEHLPSNLPTGHENKILMAQALRDDFLKSLKAA